MIDSSKPVAHRAAPGRLGRVESVGQDAVVVRWDDGVTVTLRAADLVQPEPPDGEDWPPRLERK